MASALELPDLGEITAGTAGGGVKGTKTTFDEIAVYSEDFRRMIALRKVEAITLNIPVPLILPGAFFRGRRLIFDYRSMTLTVE